MLLFFSVNLDKMFSALLQFISFQIAMVISSLTYIVLFFFSPLSSASSLFDHMKTVESRKHFMALWLKWKTHFSSHILHPVQPALSAFSIHFSPPRIDTSPLHCQLFMPPTITPQQSNAKNVLWAELLKIQICCMHNLIVSFNVLLLKKRKEKGTRLNFLKASQIYTLKKTTT